MKTVLVESPYAGDVESNIEYLKECLKDCLNRGEAPFASHLFYTIFLDDNDPAQRAQGINAGLDIGDRLDSTVVYIDKGISIGMKMGIAAAEKVGRKITYRSLKRGNLPGRPE